MSGEPFDAELVVQRLRQSVPALLSVGTLSEYDALPGLSAIRPPCSYVLLATEVGEPLELGAAPAGQQLAVQQLVATRFAVATAVRNWRDPAGAQASQDLRGFLGSVRTAIVGWTPNLPGARPCAFERGYLQDHDKSTVLWIDLFLTQHFINNR